MPCRPERPSSWRASIPGRRARSFRRTTQSHAGDRYFQESGGAIRFFFEEDATDQPVPLSLNKIGHALHDLDPVFDRISRQPRMAALARALGLVQPLLLQSMYLFKQPQIGAEVGWHQDATYLFTPARHGHRPVDRPRRCRSRQWLPDGAGGCPSRAFA